MKASGAQRRLKLLISVMFTAFVVPACVRAAGTEVDASDALVPDGTAQSDAAIFVDAEVTFSCGDTTGLQHGAPWPMFRACPTHIGRSAYKGPDVGEVRGRLFTIGDVLTTPVIGADGTIYAVSTGKTNEYGEEDHWADRLYAVDPEMNVHWVFDSEWVYAHLDYCFATPASPAIGADGAVYFPSDCGKALYAVNPDGSERWRIENIYSPSSPVIGGDGTIYLTNGGGSLIAISPDGTEKWRFSGMISGIPSSPVIDSDGIIYFVSMDGNLYAVDRTGQRRWHFSIENTFLKFAVAIGENGILYVGSDDGNLNAVNQEGSLKWRTELEMHHHGFLAIGPDHTIYVPSNPFKSPGMYAFTPEGAEKWFITFSSSVPIVDTNGIIYVGNTHDGLYAIRPDATVKWNLDMSEYCGDSGTSLRSSIGTDGTIYMGCRYSLIAIGP